MMKLTQVDKALRSLGVLKRADKKAAGQTLPEYGLLLGAVTLAALLGLTQMRDMFIEVLNYLSDFLSNLV